MNEVDRYGKAHKFLTHQMSLDEKEEFLLWLKEDNNAILFQELEQIWIQSNAINYPKFDSAKAIAKHKDLISNKGSKSLEINRKRLLVLNPIRWVAASIVLLIVSLFVYDKLSSEVYQGENMRVALVDGSVIWLERNAKLEVDYSSSKRKINLTGKAYFDVAKDAKRPFEINSGKATVTVVGTSFILDGVNGIVSVRGGKIKVNIEKNEVQLLANQELSWKSNMGITILDKTFDKNSIWFNEEMIFDNVPFDKVINDISLFYGTQFQILQEKDWSLCPFSSGSLKNNTLDQVLEILKTTYNLKFEKLKDGTIVLSQIDCD